MERSSGKDWPYSRKRIMEAMHVEKLMKPVEKVDREAFCAGMNRLRGLFAIQIIIGHVVRQERSLISLAGRFMIISVAYFFFCSGMGMAIAYDKKEDYLKHFLRKRILYLLLLAAAAYVYRCIVEMCLHFNLRFRIADHLLRSFVEKTNWYIWELLFFYLLFFAIYRSVRSEKLRIGLVSGITVLLMVFSYVFLNEAYYASAIGFPMGLCFGTYYEKATAFLKSRKGVLLTIVTAALGLSCLLFTRETFITMVILRNCICMAGLLIVSYVILFCDFDFRWLQWLKNYSTALYLCQFVWIDHFAGINLSWPVRTMAAGLATFLSAVIMKPVMDLIYRQINNIRK